MRALENEARGDLGERNVLELGGEIVGDEERDFANVPGIGPRKLSGFTNGHIPDCFKGNEWSRGRGTPCGIQGDTRAWQAVCGSHDEDWMVEATIKSYDRIEERFLVLVT